jgi:hypothetical protein
VRAYVFAPWFAALAALELGSGCSGDDDIGPTVSCYEITDAGSGPICVFGSTDEADASTACTADGSISGSCPPNVSVSDLVGCCLETLTSSTYGEPTVTATNGTCYYSPSAAEAPMAACTGFTASGYPRMWSKLP